MLAAHRQAQAKAVLGQRYMAILYDEVKGTVEVVDQGAPGAKKDAFFGSVGGGGAPVGGTMGAMTSGADAAPADTGVAPPPEPVLARELEESVTITGFRGGREFDGIYYVSYYPNGRCEGYTVELGEDEDRRTRIKVDAVTGKAEVERE